PETDGIVATQVRDSASSSSCNERDVWRPRGTERLQNVLPARPARTGHDRGADERHGWRKSQHQSGPAPAGRSNPIRRDRENQEMKARTDVRSIPASVPDLTGTQPGFHRHESWV